MRIKKYKDMYTLEDTKRGRTIILACGHDKVSMEKIKSDYEGNPQKLSVVWETVENPLMSL